MFLNTFISFCLDTEKIIEVNYCGLSAYQSGNDDLFKRIREIILSVSVRSFVYREIKASS